MYPEQSSYTFTAKAAEFVVTVAVFGPGTKISETAITVLDILIN